MKLQAKVLAVVLPAILAAGVSVLLFSKHAVETILVQGLAERAFLGLSGISNKLRMGMLLKDEGELLYVMHTAVADLGAVYVVALDNSGIVLAHTNVLEKGKKYQDNATLKASESNKPSYRLIDVNGTRVMDVAIPLWGESDEFIFTREKGGLERLGTLRVGLPMKDIFKTQTRILGRLTMILGCTGLAVVAFLLLFLRRILQPIRFLAEALGRVERGQLNVKIPIMSHDELGLLTQSFNDMSAVLSATTDYLNGAVQSMADIFIVTDSKGKIRIINRAALEILGYSEGELLGHCALRLFDQQNEEKEEGFHIPSLETLTHEGSIRDLASILFKRTGELIPVLLSGSILKNRDGQSEGLVLVARDITERIKAEEALRDSEERVRLLLDSTAEAIYGVDLQGNCTFANKACMKLLRYRREEELLGQHMHTLIHHSLPDGSALPAQRCRIDQAFREGRGAHVDEEVLWRADGSSFQAEYWSFPIFKAGMTIGAVVSFIDISERKKLEIMVMQSEKLSAVGQLAAGVAHEINNPLGIILGFAQSAAKRIQATNDLALPIRSIEREALRCKNLVQNLLAFSRQNKPQMEAFDFNEMVTSTLTMVEAQGRVRDVQVDKNLGALEQFVGDKNQLQQVLVNLCGNSIDAMPKGGKLTVRTTQTAAMPKPHILLEVEDNGSGIPASIRDKIFEPFFTTKEVGKGTGLGLSLVYEIVRRHNGSIELKSAVGQGTTFFVYLPFV